MKSKLFKRLTAGIVTLAMTASLFAGSVFAADGPTQSTLTITAKNTAQTDTPATGEEMKVDGSGVSGITFGYLNVGTVETIKDNTDNYVLAYGVKTGSNFYNVLNLNNVQALEEDQGIKYFSAQSLNTALEIANKQSHKIEELKSICNDNLTPTDVSGVTKKSLENGLYLIVEKSAPANVTTAFYPFLVSLPMPAVSGDDTWNYNVFVYPKAIIDEIQLNMYADTDNQTPEKNISASFDDKVNLTTVVDLPTVTGEPSHFTKFDFTVDTKGLSYPETLTETDIVITGKADETDKDFVINKDYTATGTGNRITITAEDTLLTWLYDNATKDSSITVKLTGTVNPSAEMGDNGNTSSVRLDAERITGSADIIPSAASFYTYGLDLTKTLKLLASEEGTENPIKGIEANAIAFTLEKDGQRINVDDSFDVVATGGTDEIVVPATTDKTESKLSIKGLESGTYSLTEIRTMDGFIPLKDPIQIVINDGIVEGGASKNNSSATVDGEAVAMTQSGESSKAIVPLTIQNTQYKNSDGDVEGFFNLPLTGGMGTYALVTAGVALIAAAIVLFVVWRRKKSHQA